MSTASEVNRPNSVDSNRIANEGHSESSEDYADSSGPKTVKVKLTPKANIPLSILASLSVLFAVYFARAIIMPLFMAVLLALLLRPMARSLRRYHIPHYVGEGVLVLVVLLVIGIGGYYLSDPAQEWIENAPKNLKTAGQKLSIITEQLDKINETSEKMGEIANGKSDPVKDPYPFAAEPTEVNSADSEPRTADVGRVDGIRTTADRETKLVAVEPVNSSKQELRLKAASNAPVAVEIKQPKFQSGIAIFNTTGNILSQFFIVLVLAYFLLAWGDILINNVLHTLSTIREKRSTVELIHSIEEGISTYLTTVTCINIGLGFAIGTAMWLFGMPNPVLWGVMAMLFNYVPYLGALVGIGVVFVVALLSFDSFSYSLCVPLTYFALTTVEGNLVTPYFLGRSMSLNPILIFLSLIFWSWMWGIGGAILAVPLLAIMKISFDQFERTKSLGILLGGGD